MNQPILRYIAFAFVLLAAGCQPDPEQSKMPELRPTFLHTDKKPLGMYVAYHGLQSAFTSHNIEQNNKPFEDFLKSYTTYDYTRKGNLFCVFSKQFYPNEQDVEAMTDFVSNGNTLLIVTNRFNGQFLNKFHLEANQTYPLQMAIMYKDDMAETGLAMKDSSRFGKQRYSYFFYPLTGQINREESYPALQVVKGDDTMTGAVVFKYGSGRIIAVSNATAFTNYFLLTRNNYQYLEQLLSYVPEDITGITWDTYYNKLEREKDDNSFSAFQELMKQPPMRWAFWLTLLLAATWIINGIIRRQRVIEVIKPNSNTSVEFAETIGRLYLLKKDNKNIAAKMITYFLEYVRSRYYISTGTLNNEFAQLLTAKSGQPASQTELLLKTIDKINVRDNISDIELLELNTILRQFVK